MGSNNIQVQFTSGNIGVETEIETDIEVEVKEIEPKPTKKSESKVKAGKKAEIKVIPEHEIIAPDVQKVTFIVNGMVVETSDEEVTADYNEVEKSENAIPKPPKLKTPVSGKSKTKKQITPADGEDIYRTREDEDGQLTLF